jgi:hypothetical protein
VSEAELRLAAWVALVQLSGARPCRSWFLASKRIGGSAGAVRAGRRPPEGLGLDRDEDTATLGGREGLFGRQCATRVA